MNIALLKNILKEKKINHKLITKTLASLKDVCVYCKIHKLSDWHSSLKYLLNLITYNKL